MKIFAVANQKGGVGKTTTVVNIAAAIAEKEKKVLCIDADPQANLSDYLGYDFNTSRRTLLHILKGENHMSALSETQTSISTTYPPT